MSDLRKLLDIVQEHSDDGEPQIGDIVEIEMGDTLLETYIEDITEDGVIVKVDETAIQLMINARKQLIENDMGQGNILDKQLRNIDPEDHEEGEGSFVKNQIHTMLRVLTHLENAIGDDEDLPEWVGMKISQAQSMIVGVMDFMVSDKEREVERMSGDEILMREGGDGSYPDGSSVKTPGADEWKQEYQKAVTAVKNAKTQQEYEAASDRAGRIKDLLASKGIEVDSVLEAEYQGRKVQLNKPMAGDVKKSKVYVKKPNGKVVKVNFGDKKMRIKKSNPNRRKSFRARHRCENPGPKWKARYWSCRAW